MKHSSYWIFVSKLQDYLNKNNIELVQYYETYSLVGKLLHKFQISLTQPTFLRLTFRSLSEAFIRRSMINSSSSFCHDSDLMWQEIGRT